MEPKWKRALTDADLPEIQRAKELRAESKRLQKEAARIMKRVNVRCQKRLDRAPHKEA